VVSQGDDFFIGRIFFGLTPDSVNKEATIEGRLCGESYLLKAGGFAGKIG
jgi:hypothetical protein